MKQCCKVVSHHCKVIFLSCKCVLQWYEPKLQEIDNKLKNDNQHVNTMKKILLLCAVMTAMCFGVSAQNATVTGRILQYGSSEPVFFSQVKILKDSIPIAECTTEFDAKFKLVVPLGDYILSISHIGYYDNTILLSVKGDIDVGVVYLEKEPVYYIIREDEGIIRRNLETPFGIEKLTIQY